MKPSQKEEPLKPRPSTMTPLTLGLKDVDSSMSELVRNNHREEEESKFLDGDEENFSDVEIDDKENPAALLNLKN